MTAKTANDREATLGGPLFCPPILVLALTPAFSQRVELFGKYQFAHLHPFSNAGGWNGSLTGNFKPVLGITADFSGGEQNNTSFYTHTFGPGLGARLPVVQPFVHALFGGGTARASRNCNRGFAIHIGGGLAPGCEKELAFAFSREIGSARNPAARRKTATAASQPELC